jgi:transposase-like protein
MEASATELIDTGEKRDARGRRLTPAARRAELVAAWRESGLTQAAFARREGLKYPTFATWVQEARTGPRRCGSGAKPAGPVRFAEVRWPPSSAATAALAAAALAPTMPAAGLEVRLPDGTVVRGDRATDLAALIRALRG